MILKRSLPQIFAVIFGCIAISLPAAQTNNHGIHALPVPAGSALKIDGDLSDWDTSGMITICYDLETLRDIYSAQVAAMYDEHALYVAIHWKDPLPMGNSHDPRYQAGRAWAGDCAQLRFKTDRISHITAWYYAPRNEPAMQIAYGKNLTEPFGGGEIQLHQEKGWMLQRGVEMAFKKDPDNKGYVQEMKIPWELLTTSKKYQAGDQFSLGIELLWGEADWPSHRYADNLVEGTTDREFFWTAHTTWGPVYLETKGKYTAPKPVEAPSNDQSTEEESGSGGPIPISYTLTKESRVTLAIDDSQGHRIRNLIPALPRPKGANTDYWDGLDDNGKAVPPGEYTFKMLTHDGIRVNYAVSFANPGHPSWPTPDGRGAFYADHTAPQAAAAGGKFVALACPMGEAGQHLIACDLTGQRLWGLNNRNAFDGGRISLATDGQTLWVANEGKQSIIYRVELATGLYSPWDATQKDSHGNEQKTLDLRVSELPGLMTDPKAGPNLAAISWKKGALAAAFIRENEVRIYHPESGALLSRISIPTPRGLTFTPKGDLVILSGENLFQAKATDATTANFSSPQPLSTQAYPGARAITTDSAGNIYVSVRGEDQNIKVLSPTGTLIREIGARGGRPASGKFNHNAMRSPGGMAIDNQGQLWVTEDTTNPKRTSVWDAKTGKLLRDLSGTTYYASAGALNPFDTSMGFSDNTVYKIDWQKNVATPVYSLGKSENPDDLFPPSVHNLTSRTVRHDGHLYVFTTDNARGSADVHCTMLDANGNWRSVAHVGVVRLFDKKGPSAKYLHPFFAGHENQLYSWTDENSDGLVQQTELKFSSVKLDDKTVAPRSYYWGQLPGEDGTITYMVKDRRELLQFPIISINPAGAPVYDIERPRVVRASQDIIGKGGSGEGMIIGGSEGRVYLNQDPLTAVAADGTILGTYPNRNISVHGSHHAAAARPGYVIGPSSIIGTAKVGDAAKGEAGDVFCLNGNLGENYLFTQDALYIQTLFKDTRGLNATPLAATPGIPMDDISAGGESFGGNFLRTPEGKTYIVLGSTDARVLEVSGLESIRRFTGKFSYTPAQYTEVQKHVSQKIASAQKPKIFEIPKANTIPVIDGKLENDWPGESTAAIEVQENPRRRYARVQASYDNENLYLAYTVYANRKGMKNAGQDEHLLFKTGDAVDLMLVEDHATGKEKSKPADNPLRLIMTQKGDKTIAVLNQKKAVGASPSEKYDFSSPWRTITFDRVAVVPAVRLATSPTKNGYAVEAAIPWSILGISPKSGQRFRADVGILYGDGKSQTTSRQYWSNKATNLVNDIPGEADLTPTLWGTFILQ